MSDDDVLVDAEMIRDIVRLLQESATVMEPSADRIDDWDNVKKPRNSWELNMNYRKLPPPPPGGQGIGILIGAGAEHFGAFEPGEQLHRVYERSQSSALDNAAQGASKVHEYASALAAALDDLEDSDELSSRHFKAITDISEQGSV